MKKKLCLIETTKHRENLGSTLSHEHVHLLNAKVKHQVVVLADSIIDIEVDPKLHILMKHETKMKTLLQKSTSKVGRASGCMLSTEAPKLSAQQKMIAVILFLCQVQDRMQLKRQVLLARTFILTLVVSSIQKNCFVV